MRSTSKDCLHFLFWLTVASTAIFAFAAADVVINESECHTHEDGGCSHCHDPCDIGDVFFQWNCLALEANVLDHNGEASGVELSLTQGPPLSARALAMIHIAMFDAYNVVRGGGRYETYQPGLRENIRGQGASVDAAVAKAAHTVMTRLYATNDLILEMIDGALERTLNGIRSAPKRRRGERVGLQVAESCMKDRENDGYAESDPYLKFVEYTPDGTPGDHVLDPNNPFQGFLTPGAGYMPPFGMDSILAFRSHAPPGLAPTFEFDENNEEYVAALMEVMEKGIFRGGMASDPLPQGDAGYDIANYWSYNGSPCTGTPPRMYNMIARDISKQMENSLDDNALLFTMINVALGNAGISSWESKYLYRLWRPVVGVRHYMGTSEWSPLGASRSNPYPGEGNFSPPFPAYNSGHATFGAAAFKILMNFYQTADLPFTFVSDEWNDRTRDQFGRVRPLRPRTFASLRDAMAENAASRVFNGVHWRYDGTAGVTAGCEIADYVFTTMFLPRNPAKRSERIAIPDGDVNGTIDCILEHPDYQETGDCAL